MAFKRELLPIADTLLTIDVDAMRAALLAASDALRLATSDMCVGCPGGAAAAARAAAAILTAAAMPADSVPNAYQLASLTDGGRYDLRDGRRIG